MRYLVGAAALVAALSATVVPARAAAGAALPKDDKCFTLPVLGNVCLPTLPTLPTSPGSGSSPGAANPGSGSSPGATSPGSGSSPAPADKPAG